MIFSIDIGKEYLAIASKHIEQSENANIDLFIQPIIVKNNTLMNYPKKLCLVFDKLIPDEKLMNNGKCEIWIEKQYNTNTRAMMIMSMIIMYCVSRNIKYTIIDPKEKFKVWGIPIDKKNKEHKKESIRRAFEINKEISDILSVYQKMDDLADAVNMLITHLSLLHSKAFSHSQNMMN